MCGLLSRALKSIGESRWFMSVQERDFRRLSAKRKSLSPDEFAKAYYHSHPCPTIPARVSQVACTQLGVLAVDPNDDIAASFPDIDFDEVVKDVADELGVPFEQIDFSRFTGTVDNLVEEMTRIRMST
jgi:hypothetical protein